MRITVRVQRSGAAVQPELLVKFVKQECREVTEPSPVLVALALAAVSQDNSFFDRLARIISPSDSAEEILAMHRDLFIPALYGFQAHVPEISSETEGYKAPDEALYQTVRSYALEAGREMLASGDYEYVSVFELLTRSGLQIYPFRLYQFMDACERFNDDPESLVREGLEIIDLVTTSPTNQN